jgi:hypothetical protein
MGPKRKLTIPELQDIHKEITQAAIRLDAKDVPEVKILMQDAILSKRGLNAIADRDTFAPMTD